MYQPIISNNAKQQGNFLNSFGGLNRKEYAKDNEFADMSNLSPDKFPYISVRKGRSITRALENSDGVISKDDTYAATCNPNNECCNVRFNEKNLIFPDENLGEGLTLIDKTENVYAKTSKLSSGIKNVLSLQTENYGTWDEYFKVGDRISISGAKNISGTGDDINTNDVENVEDASNGDIVSCTILEIDEYTMTLDCRDKTGAVTQLIWNDSGTANFNYVTVKQLIPKITDACVSNNRIFGVTESGKYIYACKLGDYKRWYMYEGISTDSWYGQVGSEGKFTGIVEFNGSIIAFKRDYIYKIYGDNPKNFTIQKQSSDGCIDKKSIVELNGRLYFLSQNGFCVYSGGYPTIISEVLNKRYINAVGGTDGRKIHFYATAEDGTKEWLVYDTVLNMWHKEDTSLDSHPSEVAAFFRYEGELYYILSNYKTYNNIYKVNIGKNTHGWRFKTPEYNTMGMNYTKLSEVIIYATSEDKETDCTMNLSVLYDGAENSVSCGSFTIKPGITQRIPIRINPCFSYSLMASGLGPIIIKAIEQIYTGGGKNDGNRR